MAKPHIAVKTMVTRGKRLASKPINTCCTSLSVNHLNGVHDV